MTSFIGNGDTSGGRLTAMHLHTLYRRWLTSARWELYNLRPNTLYYQANPARLRVSVSGGTVND